MRNPGVWSLIGLTVLALAGCAPEREAADAEPPLNAPTRQTAPVPGPVLSTETASDLTRSFADAVQDMGPEEAEAFYDDMRLVALWGFTVGIDPDNPLPIEEVDISVLRMATADEGVWFDTAFAAESRDPETDAVTRLPGGTLEDWIEYGASRLDGMSVGDIRREAGTLRRIAENKWRAELEDALARAVAREDRFTAQIAALDITEPDEEDRAAKLRTCEISLRNLREDRAEIEESLEALDRGDYEAARWVGLGAKTDCWSF